MARRPTDVRIDITVSGAEKEQLQRLVMKLGYKSMGALIRSAINCMVEKADRIPFQVEDRQRTYKPKKFENAGVSPWMDVGNERYANFRR